VNAQGNVVFVKYKWTSMQGYLNTTPRTVDAELVKDFQGATDDLYREVGKGNFPAWELSVQIATPEQLNKLDFDPFDDTKIWPESIFPQTKIGKMTLNKMPDNYFEDTEQTACCRDVCSRIWTRSATALDRTSSSCRSIGRSRR
jgi:catalase